MTKAGENISLPCPSVNEHSLVSSLEWLSVTQRVKLVEYTSATTSIWENRERMSLVPESYALNFHPTKGVDSGEYICLANNRLRADGLVRLIVQGKNIHLIQVKNVLQCFIIL